VRASLLCVQALACNPSALLAFLGQGVPLLLQAVQAPLGSLRPPAARCRGRPSCCAAPHWAAGVYPAYSRAGQVATEGGAELPGATRSDREQASLLACTSLLLGPDTGLMGPAGLEAGSRGWEKEGTRGVRGMETEGRSQEGRREGRGIPVLVPRVMVMTGAELGGGEGPMEEEEGPRRWQSARESERPEEHNETEEGGRASKRSLAGTEVWVSVDKKVAPGS